jgi:NTP pyrophosphatase (non-canonical NTP hydrolase)
MTSLSILILAAIMAGQEQAPVTALSPAQRQEFQKIAQAAEKEAKVQAETLAQTLGEVARKIDRNLLSDQPDPELHRRLSDELADAVAGLVRTAIHMKLDTARDLVKVLTPEQRKLVLAELEKPGANPDLTELLGKVFPDSKK